jgi:hypothetical protein
VGGFYEKNKMMKKIGLIIIAMITALNAGLAQNVDDALRYSQIFYNGTARFQSMGGAFTALGGDLSSLSQNPAGIGVFRSSEISITPQLYYYKSNTDFNNSSSKDNLNDFNLGQAGIVLNLRNRESGTGLVTLNIGYSFNRTNNLNQTIKIKGTSNKSSLLDYWAEISNGIADTSLYYDVPDAFLGWYTWLLNIDSLSAIANTYGTAYTNYGKYTADYGKDMTRLITNTGYTAEHAISVGGNYSNKLFFGVTLGITKIEYESKFEHSEVSDSTLASGFKDFNYTFYYRNWGTGYSLKLGVIYKPIEPLRLGLSFHTPTYFKINEYVNDNIVSDVVGKFEDEKSNVASWYNYALTTPFRATIGAAYQIRKFGVLSAEYEFIDYSMAKFSETGDDYDYTNKNDAIKNSLKSVSNIRVGAEVRLSRLYFRGGYSYYGKAYKSGDVNDNIDYSSISLGAGFREQNLFIDFAFTTMTNPQNYILYASNIETPMAKMNINRNIFTVSFGYKFGR